MILIIPDNFVGFGSIYSSDDEKRGKFYQNEDVIILFVNKVGALSLSPSINLDKVRIQVYSSSGEMIQTNLNPDLKDDGGMEKIWFFPHPASGDLYFFIGSLRDASEFKENHFYIYEIGYQISNYFDALVEQ